MPKPNRENSIWEYIITEEKGKWEIFHRAGSSIFRCKGNYQYCNKLSTLETCMIKVILVGTAEERIIRIGKKSIINQLKTVLSDRGNLKGIKLFLEGGKRYNLVKIEPPNFEGKQLELLEGK